MSTKNKKDKIKNWEKENEYLEKKMYRIYKWDFAKRRQVILDLLKIKKMKMVEP